MVSWRSDVRADRSPSSSMISSCSSASSRRRPASRRRSSTSSYHWTPRYARSAANSDSATAASRRMSATSTPTSASSRARRTLPNVVSGRTTSNAVRTLTPDPPRIDARSAASLSRLLKGSSSPVSGSSSSSTRGAGDKLAFTRSRGNRRKRASRRCAAAAAASASRIPISGDTARASSITSTRVTARDSCGAAGSGFA